MEQPIADYPTHKNVICLFGDKNKFGDFIRLFSTYANSLNISKDTLIYESPSLAYDELCDQNEVAAVYFSAGTNSTPTTNEHKAFLELSKHGCLIFPVVYTTTQEINDSILKKYNACEYRYKSGKASDTQEPLPSQLFKDLLVGLHIIDANRKVFISYKREESSKVAHQLRDALELRGYRVFLDTVSLAYGVEFQEKVMELLNDSDVFLYLHSESADKSSWVTKEVIAAEVRGVAFFYLEWPNVKQSPAYHIAQNFNLKKKHLRKRGLHPSICEKICDSIDLYRIKAITSRRSALVGQLRHHLDFEITHMAPLRNMQVVFSKDDENGILLCPYAPDSKTLYHYAKNEKYRHIKDKKVFCRLEGYAKETKEHIAWLCSQSGIALISDTRKNSPHFNIFLSASCPHGARQNQYSNDPLAIQRAILALVSIFLPHSTIVFGGHPAINPFVLEIAEQYNLLNNIEIFQSSFFHNQCPKEIIDLEERGRVTWTKAQPCDSESKNRELSLTKMRDTMLNSRAFNAAFFIGGMDGVIEEFKIFKEIYTTHTPAFVIPSTKGAAKIIAEDKQYNYMWPKDYADTKDIANTHNYVRLFSEILKTMCKK